MVYSPVQPVFNNEIIFLREFLNDNLCIEFIYFNTVRIILCYTINNGNNENLKTNYKMHSILL